MSAKSKNARGRGRPPKYPKLAGEDRSMKRFQVSLRPAVFDALEEFRKAQKFPTERSAIIETLIVQMLAESGHYTQEANGDGK